MTPILGGISITHLRTYGQGPGPDGRSGGCAHVHAICDEIYIVESGHGRVEFHDPDLGMTVRELTPGTIVQFPPGLLHRLVNDEGLVIIALLSNAGLAEAGDARIWFGPAVDGDPQAYAKAARLPAGAGLAEALDRRDRSVAAYEELVRWWHEDRERWRRELTCFRDRHAAALAERRAALRPRVEAAHPAWGAASLERLGSLPRMGATGAVGTWHTADHPDERLGMCGQLRCIV